MMRLARSITRRLTQWRVLCFVLISSLLFSAGGIAYAVWCGSAADGQRGGAIAVAISFLALFAARATPADTLEMKDSQGRLVADHGEPSERIGIVRTTVSTMLDSQRLEKVFLTWSSVTGTLVWGFGDVIARLLGAPG
jgi:hypothetical protein